MESLSNSNPGKETGKMAKKKGRKRKKKDLHMEDHEWEVICSPYSPEYLHIQT